MTKPSQSAAHSAEAVALGFYYQAFFALLSLLERDTEDSSVAVEQLDDIELHANGQRLLLQLKHSIKLDPPPLTLKSRALWRTIRAWIDALPELNLSETAFHLVTVAEVPDNEPLAALLTPSGNRADLARSMAEEAERVVGSRLSARKKKQPLPFQDRAAGCEAFLSLTETQRVNLLRRVFIKPSSPNIAELPTQIARHLRYTPRDEREEVAEALVEWWDLQVVYSLCGKRARTISRNEMENKISEIISDIEHERLRPDFETVCQPDDYQPDGMLARQIRLVHGTQSDLSRAIREEWRAREQRSKWINERPSMASVVGEYDLVLREQWSDRHSQVVEACEDLDDTERCQKGLGILRWTHEDAPSRIRPIDPHWAGDYYVRGSYQVLAIGLEVGWHPDFLHLLSEGTEE